MKFTFGIVTGGEVDNKVLNSIYNLNIPEFEIIIVGGKTLTGYPKLRHISFDESQMIYVLNHLMKVNDKIGLQKRKILLQNMQSMII